MDLRLVEMLRHCKEKELEAIERWFNHTQPLALDTFGTMKIVRSTVKRNISTPDE